MSLIQAYRLRFTGYPDEAIRQLVRVLGEIDERIENSGGGGGGSEVDFDADDYIFAEVPVGAINGSNAFFTTVFEFDPSSIEVRYNGQQLRKTADYITIGNQTIQLFFSPDAGEAIDVDYKKSPGEELERFVNGEVLSGALDGSNTVFTTANSFDPAWIEVRLNGIQIRKIVDYTVTAVNQITFTEAPLSTDVVDADYLKSIIP
jgi:hypothetical protein